jgi:hypothetical protein
MSSRLQMSMRNLSRPASQPRLALRTSSSGLTCWRKVWATSSLPRSSWIRSNSITVFSKVRSAAGLEARASSLALALATAEAAPASMSLAANPKSGRVRLGAAVRVMVAS